MSERTKNTLEIWNNLMDAAWKKFTKALLWSGLLLFTGTFVGAALSSVTFLATTPLPIQEEHLIPQMLELRADVKFETERQAQDRLHSKYGGKVEHRLWDQTRVDILTDKEAIEIDFARKWAEAIGQAKYYAYVTGKDPAIILLITDRTRDGNYIYRCQTVCVREGITLYLETLQERPAEVTE